MMLAVAVSNGIEALQALLTSFGDFEKVQLGNRSRALERQVKRMDTEYRKTQQEMEDRLLAATQGLETLKHEVHQREQALQHSTREGKKLAEAMEERTRQVEKWKAMYTELKSGASHTGTHHPSSSSSSSFKQQHGPNLPPRYPPQSVQDSYSAQPTPSLLRPSLRRSESVSSLFSYDSSKRRKVYSSSSSPFRKRHSGVSSPYLSEGNQKPFFSFRLGAREGLESNSANWAAVTPQRFSFSPAPKRRPSISHATSSSPYF